MTAAGNARVPESGEWRRQRRSLSTRTFGDDPHCVDIAEDEHGNRRRDEAKLRSYDTHAPRTMMATRCLGHHQF